MILELVLAGVVVVAIIILILIRKADGRRFGYVLVRVHAQDCNLRI